MTLKTWNAILAVIAALAVSAAVLALVLRARDRELLEGASLRAEAELRGEREKAKSLARRLARDDGGGADLHRRMSALNERLEAEAAELSHALEQKGQSDSERRRLEQDLGALREQIGATQEAMARSESDLEAARARDLELAATKSAAAERLAALEARLAESDSGGLELVLRDLLARSGEKIDFGLLARVGASEPVARVVESLLADPELAASALRLAALMPGFDARRFERSAERVALSESSLRSLWLNGWIGALRRDEADIAEAASRLGPALRLALVESAAGGSVTSAEAVAIAFGLAADEEGAQALLSLSALGLRRALLERCCEDLDASLEVSNLARFMASADDVLSDLVELAVDRPVLLEALRETTAVQLARARAEGDVEGLARLVVELGLLRARLQALPETAAATKFGDYPELDEARLALPGLVAGSIDLRDSPESLCLLEPRLLPETARVAEAGLALRAAGQDAVLSGLLASYPGTRRARLGALAAALAQAIRESRPPDHFARALRADDHPLVAPFLAARLDQHGPLESIDAGLYCLARGQEKAGAFLAGRLMADIANRSRILEKLFAAGPEGIALAWPIAETDDARAVFRLIELAMQYEIAMPRATIETILRSSTMDFDRRDVTMTTFRRSLGDDFREVIHRALIAPETLRKDVLLEDFALPPDLELRPIVLRHLDAEDARMRESALRVLQHYPLAGLIDRLALLVRDEDAMVRLQLARCLARSDDEVARGILMTMTRDRSPFVREAATWGLSGHEGERVVPILRERSSDVEAEVRIAAARALMVQGNGDGVMQLIEMLDLPVLGAFTRHYLLERFGNDQGDRAAWNGWWELEGRAQFER